MKKNSCSALDPRLCCEVTGVPTNSTAYHAMAHAANPFGDGYKVKLIDDFIVYHSI